MTTETARGTDLDTLAVDTVRTLAMDAIQKAGDGHPGTAMALGPAAYVLWTRFLTFDPTRPGLVRPRPLRALQRPRLGAAVHRPAPHRLRHRHRRPQAAAPVGLDHPRPPRALPHPRGRGHHRAARPGGRQRGRVRPGRAVPGRPLQPRRPAGGRPPDLGLLLGRGHDGGRRLRGVVVRRLPAPRQARPCCTTTTTSPSTAAPRSPSARTSRPATGPTAGTPWPSRTPTTSPRSPPPTRPRSTSPTGRPSSGCAATSPGGRPTPRTPPRPTAPPSARTRSGRPSRPTAGTRTSTSTCPTACTTAGGSRCRPTRRPGPAGSGAWRTTPRPSPSWPPSCGPGSPASSPTAGTPSWTSCSPSPRSMATRVASEECINAIARRLPTFIGGSADLAESNKTDIEDGGSMGPDEVGRNLHFGIREHGMGAISNGLALHGGLRPFCATFLVFSDYMRPSVRLASLMDLPVVYVWTHDSVGLGGDGPTHQPIEHLAALRAMPRLRVMRPADGPETAEAWRAAIARTDGPTALALSRQNLPPIDRARHAGPEGLHQGAYVLAEADGGEPRLVLIATGSEVWVALEARDRLQADGVPPGSCRCPAGSCSRTRTRATATRSCPPASGPAGGGGRDQLRLEPLGRRRGEVVSGTTSAPRPPASWCWRSSASPPTTSPTGPGPCSAGWTAEVARTEQRGRTSDDVPLAAAHRPGRRRLGRLDRPRLDPEGGAAPPARPVPGRRRHLQPDHLPEGDGGGVVLRRRHRRPGRRGPATRGASSRRWPSTTSAPPPPRWSRSGSATGGVDGRVSFEVPPDIADDTEATTRETRRLFDELALPNVFIKIPATAAGVPAIRASIAGGINVNVTLIFSIQRYREVIEAYLSGLEELADSGGDLSQVASVASFFVSRVDTLVDKELQALVDKGGPQAEAARARLGTAAIDNAKLAYEVFQQAFSGPRWEALAGQGARVQRPLWASTSTKNPDYRDVAVRRGADRPRHRQHHAPGDDRGLRRPRRGPRPDGHRGPGPGPPALERPGRPRHRRGRGRRPAGARRGREVHRQLQRRRGDHRGTRRRG